MLLLGAIVASAQGWAPAGGPNGGDILALAANGSTVLAIVTPDRIYRHDDQGWKRLAELNVREIHIVGDAFFASGYGGIFRSTDRGESWDRAALDGFVYDFTVDGGALYASVDSTIYRSVDLGESWDSVAAPGAGFFAFLVRDSVILGSRGGDGSGIYRSGDRGKSWSRLTAGLPTNELPQLFHRKGADLYMAFDTRGIFRSTDAGASWSPINTGLPEQSGAFTQIVSMVNAGDEIWGAGRNGTYAFNGTQWRGVNLGRDRALAFSAGTLYRGSIDGIAVTSDSGRSWRSLNAGLMAHRVSALKPFGDAIIASAGGAVYRSMNQGRSWTRARDIGITRPAVGNGVMYGLGETIFSQGLYRTFDGLDWGEIGEGLPTPTRWIKTLAAEGDRVYAGYYRTVSENGIATWVQGGVYRSTDRGFTWQPSSNGLPKRGDTIVPVIDLITLHDAILAQTLDGLYRSTDGGSSWTRVRPDLPSASLPGIFARLGDRLFLAGSTTVYVSSDGGRTWGELKRGLESVMHIHHVSTVRDAIYLAATADGRPSRIYRLGAGEWIDITDRFPADVDFLSFVDAGDRILAATAWNSVWSGSHESSSVPPDHARAEAIGLAAAPNPFRSELKVNIFLHERTPVRITLLSPLGEEIATLHDGVIEAGSHDVKIDGASLPSGLYHLRLVSNGAVRTVAAVKVR